MSCLDYVTSQYKLGSSMTHQRPRKSCMQHSDTQRHTTQCTLMFNMHPNNTQSSELGVALVSANQLVVRAPGAIIRDGCQYCSSHSGHEEYTGFLTRLWDQAISRLHAPECLVYYLNV